MATIDLSLDALKIPALDNFNPDFGTMITETQANKGGLSTFEVNSNMMLPWSYMRPKVVVEDSVTTVVEYDAKLTFSASLQAGVTLTMDAGDYEGCEVSLRNLSAYACTVEHGTFSLEIPAGGFVRIIWNGTTWEADVSSAVGSGIILPPTAAAVQAAIDALDDWHEAWSGNLTIPYTDGVGQILTVPAIKNSRQVAVLINGTVARGPSRIVLDNVSGTGDSFQTYISSVNSYYLTIAFQVSFSSGEIKATCYSGGWSLTPTLVKVLYR